MATSASFHGVVGIQDGSRYQIDKKITSDTLPHQKWAIICVSMFGADTASSASAWHLNTYWSDVLSLM
jgi:hypothetical protein